MPKDRRDHSVTFDRSRASPYSSGCSHSRKSLRKKTLESEEILKELEDARCPVCMEHPHNAILLLCSSHEKGCHTYMCDTSYRHSNCFDQFRKSFSEATSMMPQQERNPMSTTHSSSHMIDSGEIASNMQNERTVGDSPTLPCDHEMKPKLVCPLCRGEISGWIVVESARRFMNAKSRSCACETCDFNGTYTDLRKHARMVHPLVRPTEADPERQRNWRRLERQRDLGDLLSSLQSSIGEERNEESSLSFDERGWLTVFFLVRIFRPARGSSNSWSDSSRARPHATRRRSLRRLWGESYEEENEPVLRDDDNEPSDGGSIRRRRRRRQLTSDNEES